MSQFIGTNGLLVWDTSPPNVEMRLMKIPQGALLLLGYRGMTVINPVWIFSGHRVMRICFMWGTSTECGLYVFLVFICALLILVQNGD